MGAHQVAMYRLIEAIRKEKTELFTKICYMMGIGNSPSIEKIITSQVPGRAFDMQASIDASMGHRK
jgi:hypothetical protein